MPTYHLEFDHPDWEYLKDSHYEQIADAVAAHDLMIGLPDGVTRVVDDAGLVHAALHVPPIEMASPEFGPLGVAELLARGLHHAETAGADFDAQQFFEGLRETRGMLSLLEERGHRLVNELHHRGKCCVIVEDQPEMRRFLERAARGAGFTRVLTCRSHGELIGLFDDGEVFGRYPFNSFPNVVISDFHLPGCSTGRDVQAFVCECARTRNVPEPQLIAHSASADQLEQMRGARVLKGQTEELARALKYALERATADVVAQRESRTAQ